MKKIILLAIVATFFCSNINAQNESGYRGFIDAGYTIGMGNQLSAASTALK